MVGSGISKEIDSVASLEDSFDNILDSLGSLNENLEEDNLSEGNWADKFQSLVPIPSDILGLQLISGDENDNRDLDSTWSVSVPVSSGDENDNRDLDSTWSVSVPRRQPKFSNETVNSSIQLQSDSSGGLESGMCQTPKSGSLLESGSSSIVEKSKPVSSDNIISVCSRSKRLRFPPFNRWLEISPSSVTSRKSHQLAASEAFSQSDYFWDLHVPKKMSDGIESKPMKKKKVSEASGTSYIEKDSFQLVLASKRCTHCKVTETPQWRMGPMGPQTLCNACGVRYRSGRLFPEYRPAASPTFVSSLHSNLHREVVKMRNQERQKEAMTTESDPETLLPQGNHEMSPPPESFR